MSFEQPVYSFNASGAEPPTPTRTPSSPNFFNNSYQTPKQDSKFNDPASPWTPAFASSPLFSLAPLSAHTPPINGDLTSAFSEKSKTAEDVASEVAARAQFSTTHSSISLAPVDTSRQLPSSPQTSLHIETSPTAASAALVSEVTPSKASQDQAAASESMNSAGSIQTPPPTSTSTSRRKASEAQVARSARALASKGEMPFPASSAAGNNDAIASTSQQVEESPSAHFPNLQFSPDGYAFPLSGGPATAPVYPQHKLFWDPDQTTDAMNLDFPMDDSFTNFGLGLQKQLEPFVSEHDLAGSQAASTHPFSAAGTSAISITDGAVPRHSVALNQLNISPSVAVMTQGSSRGQFTGTVVNPSLLFSSPHGNLLAASESIQDDSLKPYAHQIQDAEYEKELQSRRPKRKRGAELDSPAVKAATQALRGAEDSSSVDSSDAVVASFAASRRPSSRHSRNRSIHLRKSSSGQEIVSDRANSGKRTSVTLTIDENGRAKTETKVVEGSRLSISSKMNLDNDSSDSESSSSQSSQGLAFSQPSSFAYPVERQKRSKPPRSRKGHSIQPSHSHHSSYASTHSNSVFSHDSHRRPDHRKHSQPQVHFEDSASSTAGTGPSGDLSSEAETIVDTDDDNKGNAASELRKVVRQRSSNQNLRKNSSSSSLPRRQSFADHRIMPPSTTTHTLPPHPYYNNNHATTTPSRLSNAPHTHSLHTNISPTTITDPDIATPSTGGRTGLSARSATRCVCNITEGDGLAMVQCDSCKSWLHLDCVGLNHRNIPEIYLCIFCNHETPKQQRGARGGGGPARGVFTTGGLGGGVSPLGYKSGGVG